MKTDLSRLRKSPSVAIVVLNWNNADDTLQCLDSVSHLDYGNFSVTVVDNGSTDDSARQIRQAFPEIDFLQLDENLGYAEGNNAGIRRVMRANPTYVLVLNNDTLVEPQMLTELVNVAEGSGRIALVGPMVRCWNSDSLFAAGSFVKWNEGELLHRGLFQPARDYERSGLPEPVDFIVGCGVLVRREFIEEAGVLDPLYYLNFEDVEWGVRARRLGYEVIYVPRAKMWHKVSATLGLASPANTYYMTRNALLFFWRNSPSLRREIAVSRILARTLRTVAAWTLKRRYRSDDFRRKRNANLLAVRDFFLGRFGKMGQDVQRVCYGG